jgi:hypothetical protein
LSFPSVPPGGYPFLYNPLRPGMIPCRSLDPAPIIPAASARRNSNSSAPSCVAQPLLAVRPLHSSNPPNTSEILVTNASELRVCVGADFTVQINHFKFRLRPFHCPFLLVVQFPPTNPDPCTANRSCRPGTRYILTTMLPPVIAIQILAPSNAARPDTPGTGKVPSSAPSLARSLVTVRST